MRLWLSKNSEVPLREQLTTQIILGIVSDDLKAGQRLPSTRELARRFHVHSNTVSAAYRELARRGWLEFRKGSGVYVRPLAAREEETRPDAQLPLDQIISVFLRAARERGFSLAEVRARVSHWLELQPPDHFLVVEPDAELRPILVAEIEQAAGFPVRGAAFAECADGDRLTGAAVVALYGQAEGVRAALPPGTTCHLLHSRSVPESLAAEKMPPPDALISVVSRWPDFLRWAHVVLIAAGIDPHALDFRDARQAGWQKGLRSSDVVIADAVTAESLPPSSHPRVFRMIADSSLRELRAFVEQFLSGG